MTDEQEQRRCPKCPHDPHGDDTCDGVVGRCTRCAPPWTGHLLYCTCPGVEEEER